jgi:hypothetical protein
MMFTELAQVCIQLRALQKKRRYAIANRRALNQRTDSYVLGVLNYMCPEKKLTVKTGLSIAGDIRECIEGGKVLDEYEAVQRDVELIVMLGGKGREGFDTLLTNSEAEITGLAKTLPGAEYVSTIHGFTHLGFGVYVAEATSMKDGQIKLFGEYTFPQLQKRCGIAVIKGYAQNDLPPGLSPKEKKLEWTRRGYNKHRRSEIWQFADSMYKAQYRSSGEHRGPYGVRVAWKMAQYRLSHPDWLTKEHDPKGFETHLKRASRRWMEKILLRDLWWAWRREQRAMPHQTLELAAE